MNSLDYVVDKVLEVIRRDIRKNTSDSYDIGTVKRIDGNIAWVQYDENNPQVTPVVISGASCKKGDKVRIKNNNGTAFILGNDSNPPTDDTKAEHAQVTADISGRTAEEAQTMASEAEQTANGIKQHFWTDDDGAHVTQTIQEEYEQDPDNAGSNMLADSDAMHFRNGQSDVARFGASGAQIGQDSEAHSTVEKDRMEVYLDGDEQPYFHVGMLKDPTALYYQSSNKVLGADIRKNTGTRIAPCFIGQWGVAWAYTASFPICPIDVSLDISYTGTAPTTNVYWLDWYVEQNKREALYGTADVIAGGEKLGWSTRAKCESAVTSFLASYDYPNDYLRTVQFGAGYGQKTSTVDGTDYTYWTYNYETNHNFNPNYDVQACILYLKTSTVTKYELWVGGHAVTGSDAFIISTRCKSITTNYKLYTEEIIASFFAGDGIVPTNRDQFVIGSYNDTSTDDVAFVVGNGTDDSHRSNCFTVARDGTIRAGDIIGENIHSTTGDITDSKGNKLSNKADASDVPTKTSQLTNDSGFISEDNNGDIAITRNITAGGELTASNIGDKNWVAPSSVSCQSGKWYKVAEVTLDPGIWFIDCNAYFPKTNATGTRQIRVTTATFTNGTTTAPGAYGSIGIDVQMGANTAQYPQSHFPVDISSQTTFRLAANQGSGSAMSVTGRMYATRIK